jgi:16S rRNA (guanine527-N7)-methyltransferase
VIEPSPGPDGPPAAAAAFGAGLPRAEQFAALLATDGIVRGMIGPAEVSRLWSRHLLNSIAIAPLIPRDVDVLDVGSGAGLPGIPLAIARPDLAITLVEPLLRRATWLEEVVGALGLDRVEVVRARAEELSGRISATYVTARAVAPLPRLAAWCLPLVRPEGYLLALKGRSARDELAAAGPVLQGLGATEWRVLDLDSSDPVNSTFVVQVKVGSSGPSVGRSRVARTRSGTRRRRTHP